MISFAQYYMNAPELFYESHDATRWPSEIIQLEKQVNKKMFNSEKT
jgi:hypothetical protein